MRRFAIGFGGVLLAALAAFFIFAPGYVERDMNVGLMSTFTPAASRPVRSTKR